MELITAWHAYHPEGVRARVVTRAQMQRAAYGENFPAGDVTFNRGMQPHNATLQGENQGNKGPNLSLLRLQSPSSAPHWPNSSRSQKLKKPFDTVYSGQPSGAKAG